MTTPPVYHRLSAGRMPATDSRGIISKLLGFSSRPRHKRLRIYELEISGLAAAGLRGWWLRQAELDDSRCCKTRSRCA